MLQLQLVGVGELFADLGGVVVLGVHEFLEVNEPDLLY